MLRPSRFRAWVGGGLPGAVRRVRGLRGSGRPERVERGVRVDGGRVRFGEVPGCEVVADGVWLAPGLVDLHAHPGVVGRAEGFDVGLFREQMAAHRDAGVLLVRAPGLPEEPGDEPELPRFLGSGRWLATPGRFFAGAGRRVDESGLARAAVEEALGSSGWCKVIGDWLPGVPAVPLDVLTGVVEAVHAVGGRVAVHCQSAEGSRNAVLAGADSLEHGMFLDPDLLPVMAERGTALVPTFSGFARTIAELEGGPRGELRDWLVAGWESLRAIVPLAHRAGVRVLAGTDSELHGAVAGEVEWLWRAGLPGDAAVGAASWAAREWLGAPGLVDGAPADLVAFDRDPTEDPSALREPRRIVLRGRLVR